MRSQYILGQSAEKQVKANIYNVLPPRRISTTTFICFHVYQNQSPNRLGCSPHFSHRLPLELLLQLVLREGDDVAWARMIVAFAVTSQRSSPSNFLHARKN